MHKWYRLGRTRIAGASVYLHWSVLAVAGVLALLSLREPIYGVIAVVSYFSVIVIHELGHALIARRLGYEVDAIRIAVLHGRCEHEAPHVESDAVLIAWGGVLAQLAIAIPVVTLAAIFEKDDLGYLAPAVVYLGYLNILVALINLAPAPGFDGHTAWRAIPLLGQWWQARRATKRALSNFRRGR